MKFLNFFKTDFLSLFYGTFKRNNIFQQFYNMCNPVNYFFSANVSYFILITFSSCFTYLVLKLYFSLKVLLFIWIHSTHPPHFLNLLCSVNVFPFLKNKSLSAFLLKLLLSFKIMSTIFKVRPNLLF